jgi:hypothetical protein
MGHGIGLVVFVAPAMIIVMTVVPLMTFALVSSMLVSPLQTAESRVFAFEAIPFYAPPVENRHELPLGV